MQSYRIKVSGQVQGVGFRPWVAKTAKSLNLNGIVFNNHSGVVIEISGCQQRVDNLKKNLLSPDNPGHIHNLEISKIPYKAYKGFKIVLNTDPYNQSIISSKNKIAQFNYPVIPDRKICDSCVEELFESSNRRFNYPFITCASCGPRFSILKQLPFERHNTEMDLFSMCSNCTNEYQDSDNARFHAQTISCAKCGPELEFYRDSGELICKGLDAFNMIVTKILAGTIVAIKGIGGYHLVCDASNTKSVSKIREVKIRKHKPLAVMMTDLDMVNTHCEVTGVDSEVLQSDAAPIVLIRKKQSFLSNIHLSDSLALGIHELGVMLPYTGLHHMLLRVVNKPLVFTSCNATAHPICYKLSDVIEQFNNKISGILSDNRPVNFPCDDSVVRVIHGKPRFIRRARGYPLQLNNVASADASLSSRLGADDNSQKSFIRSARLSVGAYMKNTIALSHNNRVYMSPYLGDMTSKEQLTRFDYYHDHLIKLLNVKNIEYITDLHPEYMINHEIDKNTNNENYVVTQRKAIQHHKAHALASLAEYKNIDKSLIFVWDGTGLGDDGTIWGGETFSWQNSELKREVSCDGFSLIGYEQAIKQPKRVALALILSIYNNDIPSVWMRWIYNNFSEHEYKLIRTLYHKGINCIQSSSMGRLFDAVAALLGVCSVNDFDGHAPMLLEACASQVSNKNFDLICSDNIFVNRNGLTLILWQELFKHLESLIQQKIPIQDIAYNFHLNLAHVIVKLSINLGHTNIMVNGGVFQNKLLVELCIKFCKQYELNFYYSEQVPVNDSGLSLGQLYV